MPWRNLLLASLLLGLAQAAGAAEGGTLPVAGQASPAEVTLDAMKAELGRSMKQLKLKDHDAPYFISYQVVDRDQAVVDAHYGALFADQRQAERRFFVDVRVGSYASDNSGVDPMMDLDLASPDPGYQVRNDGPLDGDPAALRQALWLMTDARYKQALSTYLRKRARTVNAVDDESADVPSFSKEKPNHHVEPTQPLHFDHERWAALSRKISLAFKAHPEIFDSDVKIDADHQVRYFVSSEGGRIVTQSNMYGIHIDAVARATDGQLLENSRDLYAPTEGELPDEAKLLSETHDVITELLALREAPVIDPYTGPALLRAAATGVLFHEAVGHRLEGDRQDDNTEGRTFKGQVGHAVLPAFISVVDDPSLAREGQIPLNGFYRYDEQGVATSPTTLVKNGVLEGYLLSRHMVKGFVKSNGHGRSQGARAPAARMGNLIVTATPARERSWKALKAQLIEIAKAEGKPYGLIIEDMTGGNTNTSSYGYQAFKAQPRLVYRVEVKTGKEQLVRGVEMVGTPLTVINKIVALGDEPGVFNGYCGAESGYVPVSTVAPAALITEVELQRTTKTNQRPPLLPSPWAGAK